MRHGAILRPVVELTRGARGVESPGSTKGNVITKQHGRWAEVVSVAVGGVVGTGLRFATDSLLPHDSNEFPISTLIANVVGSFALGFLVARIWPLATRWLRAGLGVGLIGSFTTFSAVMISLLSLGNNGEWFLALGYLTATVVLGIFAAYAGLLIGSGKRARPYLKADRQTE